MKALDATGISHQQYPSLCAYWLLTSYDFDEKERQIHLKYCVTEHFCASGLIPSL